MGRVISYDRRGCGRSERPDPYERTSVAEQADDAGAGCAHARGGCARCVDAVYKALIGLRLTARAA